MYSWANKWHRCKLRGETTEVIARRWEVGSRLGIFEAAPTPFRGRYTLTSLITTQFVLMASPTPIVYFVATAQTDPRTFGEHGLAGGFLEPDIVTHGHKIEADTLTNSGIERVCSGGVRSTPLMQRAVSPIRFWLGFTTNLKTLAYT